MGGGYRQSRGHVGRNVRALSSFLARLRNATSTWLDVFGDDLELDGHAGEAFAVGVAFLNGELVYCSQLDALGVRLARDL